MNVYNYINFKENVLPTVIGCAKGLALAHGIHLIAQGAIGLSPPSSALSAIASAGLSILIGAVLIKLGSSLISDAVRDFSQFTTLTKTSVIALALLAGFFIPIVINSITPFLPTVHHQLYFLGVSVLVGLILVAPAKQFDEEHVAFIKREEDAKFWIRAAAEAMRATGVLHEYMRQNATRADEGQAPPSETPRITEITDEG